MAQEHADGHESYYVPDESKLPVWIAFGLILFMFGFASWLNALQDGGNPRTIIQIAGLLIVCVTLYIWFSTVIRENHAGLAGTQLKRSYVWGMSWFIFSEVMFFAAFFGALYYVRNFAVPWLGGEGDKGIAGDYLWPEFSPEWASGANPSPYVASGQSMQAPGIANVAAWAGYLPLYNTVILLTSSWTVHIAHAGLKNNNRKQLTLWLGITIALGVLFIFLQGAEYVHAYEALGLTLGSGIYGSTFYILTGFHGFHVTLGTFMLMMMMVRVLRGHFKPEDHFGFEATSWYWHFVDVVWLGLFLFVYIL
mgnify:CR=1 FL=1